ncbi:MAG: M20/M25/M40 family metallo-hydrolase [Candidatus Eisenbacteria bacterium]|uniref:M20/M25/M40 family metallo-hydrolase n=1 Tax=Eiseniibacteriota bacterium TaxID=2212470 RepID=A0A933SC27_UNCEI|nr:M20/M25/M40 family metallo-hydrolase [Candidatus Eisenbacteria bacterium]
MRRCVRVLLAALAALAVGAAGACAAPVAGAAGLNAAERRIVASVDRRTSAHVALLRRLVECNSGTLNLAGVRAVGAMLKPEWEALGFRARWVDGAPWGRAGHLLAERTGRPGAPVVVLVGHLDTVFEPTSGFEGWTELSGTAVRGPGITDMKGGDVIQLLAVHALRDAGLLDRLTIRVVLSGDEERPGSPLALARAALAAAAEGAAAVLGFEDGDGALERAVTARRGSSNWTLQVRGTPAHSSQVFRADIGPGAIFEAARVLAEVRDSLAGEPYLTFNPGFVLGGSDVAVDSSAAGGVASGKTNVVADTAYVAGDLRTLTRAQLEHARAVMARIASRHHARTDAAFTFSDGYPELEPTGGNRRLLALFSRASEDLGFGVVEAVDPMRAGAADVSFVGDRVPMTLDAVGLKGDGGHTSSEWADLRALPIQGKRVAVLLARLAAGVARSPEAAGH